MKNVLILLTVLIASNTYSQNYGTAGCGLGSQLFKDKDTTSQVLAATTNGTSGNQTFGISSGTSNCEPTAQKLAVNEFIENNKISLSSDIAKGSGSEFTTLLGLMNCQNDKETRAHFQKNYQSIFIDYKTEVITDQVFTVIENNQNLRDTCKIQG